MNQEIQISTLQKYSPAASQHLTEMKSAGTETVQRTEQTIMTQVTTTEQTIMNNNFTKFVKTLFSTENKIPYAEVAGNGRTEIYPVFSEEMRSAITQVLYKETGKAPVKNAIDQIQGTMAAEALYNGEKRTVWVRSAKTSEGMEIDVNNQTGQCISIKKEGWSIQQPSSSFYRPSSSREMMIPVTGGSWELFKKHFKTRSEEDLKLMIGYMSACLRPEGPYAVLVLQGEQGSAKSTTARMIKALIDPSSGITRSAPKKEQDLFIAAKNNHLISFDNLSLIRNDLSDALCRLATGGSFACRTLYTNDQELLIELCKPVLLNGITDFVTRADLASRCIMIELESIPETGRRPEEQVMDDFYADLPLMLGVLMDSAVSALNNKDNVRLERMPRMADVTIWATAAEEGLKWAPRTFLDAFERNQLNAALNNLSTDSVAIALRNFMFSLEKREWIGSASELLSELSLRKSGAEHSRSWPDTAAYLSQYLSRMAPNLRKVGIDLDRDRTSSLVTSVSLSQYFLGLFLSELLHASPERMIKN